MKFFNLGCTLLATLLVFSCSKENAVLAQAVIDPVSSANIQAQWRLQSIDGQAVASEINSTLHISATNSATGTLSCNRFFGTLIHQDNKIKIAKMGTTRRICSADIMAQEAAIAGVLSNWSEVSITAEQLLLLGPQHRLSYTLEK